MNESCHTYKWITMLPEWFDCKGTLHMANRVTCSNESRHTHDWVMSHVWMSQVSRYQNDLTQEVCHIWASLVTYMNAVMSHMNKSCRTYTWVMSHVYMSRVATRMVFFENRMVFFFKNRMVFLKNSFIWMRILHLNEGIRHDWISHVSHMHESCHTCERVISVSHQSLAMYVFVGLAFVMNLDAGLLCVAHDTLCVVSWHLVLYHDTLCVVSWYLVCCIMIPCASYHDTLCSIMIPCDVSWHPVLHHDTLCPYILYLCP